MPGSPRMPRQTIRSPRRMVSVPVAGRSSSGTSSTFSRGADRALTCDDRRVSSPVATPSALGRGHLADALATAGPDAPTLCEGWTTRDLAAHVVLRERSPVAATGIVVKQMSGFTDRVRRRIAMEDYGSLVEKVRHPAPWTPVRLPAVDE